MMETTSHSEDMAACDKCDEAGWYFLNDLCITMLGSEVLAKACGDKPFDYALELRSGEVIRFEGAKVIRPGWIHLEIPEFRQQPEKDSLPFRALRGIDVRIEEILWVIDAPDGH